MNRQMQEFVRFLQQEVAFRAGQVRPDPSQGAIVPIRKSVVPPNPRNRRK
jgi:hypothetical protein